MKKENFEKNETSKSAAGKNPKSNEPSNNFAQFRSTVLHHKSDLNLSESSSDDDESDKKVDIVKPETILHNKPEVEKKKIHFQPKVQQESLSSDDDEEMASKLVNLVKIDFRFSCNSCKYLYSMFAKRKRPSVFCYCRKPFLMWSQIMLSFGWCNQIEPNFLVPIYYMNQEG
jgi:hypothetical protein